MACNEKMGDFFIQNFDKAIMDHIGATVDHSVYYLIDDRIAAVKPPLFNEFTADKDNIGKPMPGIPVYFMVGDDAFTRYSIPCIRIRREDPSYSADRNGSNVSLKYRIAAEDAEEVEVDFGGRTINGFDEYEEQNSGLAYDIPYTITIDTSGSFAKTNMNTLLKYMMFYFQPQSLLEANDSLNDKYEFVMFTDGPSSLDVISDMRDRIITQALSVRVNAVLDIYPVVTTKPALTGSIGVKTK